jgi:alkanesulfonate monooxygenase SsuD/methylene tetrahydromethanopterin reductase-like flavin-dependent oxidoreductase (luciferase family)
MLAKLAASLDLLSGGRLTLGLGGGYSDSEITALGSPALSPAEKQQTSITSISECGRWSRAAAVARGIWPQFDDRFGSG